MPDSRTTDAPFSMPGLRSPTHAHSIRMQYRDTIDVGDVAHVDHDLGAISFKFVLTFSS